MKKFHVFSVNFLFSLGLMGACIYNAQAQPWAVTDAPIIELDQKYEPRQGDVRVRIRPDGKVLATAGQFSSLHLWDLETGAKLQTYDLPSGSDFSYTSDGRLIAASWEWEKKRPRAWNVITSEELFTTPLDMPSETSFPQPVRFRTASVHLSSNGVVLTAIIFYLPEPQASRNAPGPDIHLGHWNLFKAWNLETRRPLTLPTQWKGIMAFAFNPDGKLLALGFLDGKVEVWDTASGELIQRLAAHSRDTRIDAVSFSPDGRSLTAIGGSQLFLWEVSSGKRLQTIIGVLAMLGYDPGFSLYTPVPVFSPDGALIATGVEAANYSLSNPSHIVLWHVATGKPYKILPREADSVAFSPDGKLVVTGVGGKQREIQSDGKVLEAKKTEGTVQIWVR